MTSRVRPDAEFAAGVTSLSFTVSTTEDVLFEGTETLTVALSEPTGGAVISATAGSATGTIVDDDAAPVFSIASASAAEGSAITFTVTRTGDAQASQSVSYATLLVLATRPRRMTSRVRPGR